MINFISDCRQDYISVSDYILNDKNLGVKERGLMVTLLSLPDGTPISVEYLTQILPDGKDKIRSTIKKLEELHYLKRVQLKENGRYNGYSWNVFQVPHAEA